jgi:glycoprotein endo-alpha-1,2-mannosidase
VVWRAALGSGARRVTITSYNEWGEGTQIEAAHSDARSLGVPYETYEGAWGRRGVRSEAAYLARTAHWTRAFAAMRTRTRR